MESNNVILFPKQGKVDNTITIESVNQNIDMVKHYHIQETIANIAPTIFNQLEVAGFDLSDEELDGLKSGILVIEALRSMMCKHYGIHHPFQKLSEHIFIQDEEEFGAFKIVDSINLTLKNEK